MTDTIRRVGLIRSCPAGRPAEKGGPGSPASIVGMYGRSLSPKVTATSRFFGPRCSHVVWCVTQSHPLNTISCVPLAHVTVLPIGLCICVARDRNGIYMHWYSFTYFQKGAQSSRRTCHNSTGEDRKFSRSSSSFPARETRERFFSQVFPIITIKTPILIPPALGEPPEANPTHATTMGHPQRT